MQVYALNDQLFVITKNGALTEMHMYNPVLNTWTKKANPPLTVYSFVIVVDDKIIGGHTQSNPQTNWPELGLSIYDPTTNSWSEANPSPPIRRFHYSQSVGVTSGNYAPKRLYVFGQEQLDLNTFQTFTWAYNPEDNTWSSSKTIPDSYRHSFGHLIDVIEDTFYMGTFYNAQYDPDLGMQYLPIGVQYVPIGYAYPEQISSEPSPLETLTSKPPPSNPNTSLNTTTIIVAIILTISLAIGAVGIFSISKRHTKQRALKNKIN